MIKKQWLCLFFSRFPWPKFHSFTLFSDENASREWRRKTTEKNETMSDGLKVCMMMMTMSEMMIACSGMNTKMKGLTGNFSFGIIYNPSPGELSFVFGLRNNCLVSFSHFILNTLHYELIKEVTFFKYQPRLQLLWHLSRSWFLNHFDYLSHLLLVTMTLELWIVWVKWTCVRHKWQWDNCDDHSRIIGSGRCWWRCPATRQSYTCRVIIWTWMWIIHLLVVMMTMICRGKKRGKWMLLEGRRGWMMLN